MAKHFVCTGDCGGISDKAGKCQADECEMHKQALVECNCKDGEHAEAFDL